MTKITDIDVPEEIEDPNEAEAYQLWVHNNVDTDTSVDNFRDSYEGFFDSEQDFAQHLADSTALLNQHVDNLWPLSHIDWQAASDELFTTDYTSFVAGFGVHVFRIY